MRPGDGRQTYRWTKEEVMDAFSTDKYCIEDLRGIPQDYIKKYVDDGHLSMDVCDICNSDSQKGYHSRCAHIAGTTVVRDGISYPETPTTTYYVAPFDVSIGCAFKYKLDKGVPCRICSKITENGATLCDRHRKQRDRLSIRKKELLTAAYLEEEMIEAEMIKKQIELESKNTETGDKK